MGVYGDVRTFSIPDIINWIAMGKRTGILVLNKVRETKKIFFIKGDLASAYSSLASDSLANFIVKKGILSREMVYARINTIKDSDKDVALKLMNQGLITLEDVVQSLYMKIEDVFYSVYGWDKGQFLFLDQDLPYSQFLFVRMPSQKYILEGSRRRDEWKIIRQEFPEYDMMIHPIEDKKLVKKKASSLSQTARQILGMLDKSMAIFQIIALSEFSEFDVMFELMQLKKEGLIKVQDIYKSEIFDKEERIEQHFKEGVKYFHEGRIIDAIDSFEKVLSLEPRHFSSKRYLQQAKNLIFEKIYNTIGHSKKVPQRFAEVADCTINEFYLTEQEKRILEKIDGKATVKDLYSQDEADMNTVYYTLYRLIEANIIVLSEEPAA